MKCVEMIYEGIGFSKWECNEWVLLISSSSFEAIILPICAVQAMGEIVKAIIQRTERVHSL